VCKDFKDFEEQQVERARKELQDKLESKDHWVPLDFQETLDLLPLLEQQESLGLYWV
jgi:hypothetical protein